MTLAITFTATPVLAQVINSHPGGTTINVVQGQTFTLTHVLEWTDPANPGYYSVTIFWDYTDNSTHFTLVENKAYWTDNFDPIEAIASTMDNGSRYTVGLASTVGYWGDENITVEITLRAAGPDGTAHVAGTQAISYVIIRCRESTETTAYPADVTINVQAWTAGLVVKGKDNAYSLDTTGYGDPPAMDPYSMGENPPVVAAEKIGSGAVIALGMSANLWDGRWNGLVNPAPYLDDLLDIAIDWGNSSADNILWHTGYNIVVKRAPTVPAYMSSDNMEDALIGLGYTVTEDNTEPITGGLLAPYDVLVISGYQLGARNSGGDPSLLPDADVTAINTWVQAGGVLVIFNNYDTAGYNFYKVHNKILAEVGFDWCFQSDTVQDEVDQYDAYNKNVIYAVDPTTVIGTSYQARTGTDNLGAYSATSLIPWPRLGVTVSIAPAENSAGALTAVNFVATITNTGTANDKYTLNLSDDLTWPDLTFLPVVTTDDLDPDSGDGVGVSVYENTPDSIYPPEGGYQIYVGADADGKRFRMFVKFDLSTIPAGSIILGADLEYRLRYVNENQTLSIYEVDNDAWDNDANTYLLTWNNQPDMGALIVTRDWGTDDAYDYKLEDVTGFVTSQYAGDQTAAFCFLSENENTVTDTLQFYDYRFTLEVTYEAVPPYPFLLTSITVPLDAGDSTTVDLGVTIDNAADYCTRDTLTVATASVHDSSVTGSDTCKAHSLGPTFDWRSVTVDIEPDNGEAVLVIDRDAVKKRYDPLTFKVIVTNTGKLPDKYILVATNGLGWMLELWPTELYIEPGKFDYAVLSVTVPDDTWGSTRKDIIVEAFGTMATGAGDDIDNARGLDTVSVHVKEAYCVRLDVLPFQTQTGTPGSKIRWFVKVRNLGNRPNLYGLTGTYRIWDYNNENYGSGPIEITPENIELDPCNIDEAIIDFDIPEGLETSVRIDINVQVVSLGDPLTQYVPRDCNDNAFVDIHVVRSIPKIPQGVIKIEVETEIIAIQVWPTYWDFGVLDEAETASTTGGEFTVRNIGNQPVDVSIAGNDAKSAPGELVTTWTLSVDGGVGLDIYAMWFGPPSTVLKTTAQSLCNLQVSEEYNFDLAIQAPSGITVPSRMWTTVNLTAVEA